MNETETAMQTRCPNCLAEQYVLNVIAFSNGEVPCVRCGKNTEVMSYREWYDAIAATRKRLEPS